ncbi:unnamed protein product [Camellia sinensis]
MVKPTQDHNSFLYSPTNQSPAHPPLPSGGIRRLRLLSPPSDYTSDLRPSSSPVPLKPSDLDHRRGLSPSFNQRTCDSILGLFTLFVPFKDPEELPKWNYDGCSICQAHGEKC